MRGYGILGSMLARPLLPLSFVLMAIVPFVFLNKDDRSKIGLKKCITYQSYIAAIIMGGIAALVCYVIGISLFELTDDNWYVTIKKFYLNNPAYNASSPLWQTFLIFTVPALIFSPVGEEIFFRGLFQESLKLNFTERTSTFIECTCFGIIHLFHHGLVAYNSKILFFPFSGFIWVALMASVAFMFVQIRKQSQSLYPAMACHASFNLSMNTIIFSLV